MWVAVATALAVLGLACGDGSGSGRDAPSTETAAGGWRRLPAAPIGPRTQAVAVWTGEEVVVAGGITRVTCPRGGDCGRAEVPDLTDGAAYDPRTGRWRRIADAPRPLAWTGSAVVDGVAYVLDREAQPSPLLRYDPKADTWTPLGTPFEDASSFDLVAVPGGVVAYAGSDEGGERPDFLLDTTTGEWAELPPDPLSPSFDRWVTATDSGFVLFDHALVPNPGSDGPSVTRAASYDTTTRAWERLPDSEILYTSRFHEADGVLVNPMLGGADGGEVNGWGRTYPNGGMFDLATREWSPLPQAPDTRLPAGGVVTAEDADYWGAGGLVLDTTRRRWEPVPALDRTEATTGRSDTDRPTFTAIGRDLFVFGGVRWDPDGVGNEILGDAWTWSPP